MAADSSADHRFDATALATAIQRGDRAAEQQLVKHYQRGVRALVVRHCRLGECRVDDLCQDILLRLLQKLREGAIADPQALAAYLQTMIRHACAELYRAASPVQAPMLSTEAADAGPGPEERLEAEDAAVHVKSLLEQLPVARDRELLRQFYLLGRSQSEVCSALQIDNDHFRRVAHRARNRLRDLILQSRWLS